MARTLLEKKRLSELRGDIKNSCDTRKSFSHNIVSSLLREIEKRFGIAAANEAVKDFDLTALFGIYPERE